MTKKLISMMFLLVALSFYGCASEETPVDETPGKTDAQSVTDDKAALDFTDFTFGGTDTETSVTQNFSVPTSGSSGTTITWAATYTAGGADASSVIASDGTVTRPAFGAGDAVITLTATIEKNGVSETKTFQVTVLETPPTDSEAVAADKAALDFADFTFGGTDTETTVTQDFSLPTSGSSGTTISWSSDNASVSLTDSAATVTQPLALTGDIIVTLTATIIKNGVSETKDLTITVLEATSTPVAAEQVTYTAGVSFNMRYVPGGLTTPTALDDSGTATVSNAYLMAETEITYELWYAVYTWATHADRGANIYTFANAGREGHDGIIGGTPVSTEPVTYINWRDAIVFSNALTEYYNAQNGTSFEVVYYSDGDGSYTTPHRDSSDTTCACDNPDIKTTAKGFRLPTGDEWELAARYKGSDSANGAIEKPASSGNWWTPGTYASGATADTTIAAATDLVAWYFGNSGYVTHNVATKTANALGLYDMSGNIYELAFDWHPDAIGTGRLWLGGSYIFQAADLQIGKTVWGYPYTESTMVGFRLSRTP